jgi:hypothetical protein
MDKNNSKAVILVDQAIKNISGQQLVSSAEMTDLLLDIRIYLMTEDATPTTNESLILQ